MLASGSVVFVLMVVDDRIGVCRREVVSEVDTFVARQVWLNRGLRDGALLERRS